MSAMTETESETETEIWPPQWKPFMECPQFRYGMIHPKIYEWDLDQFEGKGDCKKFIQQLRDSRGYDIDCHPPSFVTSNFWAESPEYLNVEDRVMNRVRFAVEEINAQAKKHGESCKFKEIVRVVQSFANRCVFLTFNVMEAAPNTSDGNVVKTVQAMVFKEAGRDHFELLEWRFRPGPPLIPPETSPQIPPETSPEVSVTDL